MSFHGVSLGNPHEILLKEHNGKVRRLDPTGERQQADRDIGNPIVEIVPPLGLYRIGHFSHEAQND